MNIKQAKEYIKQTAGIYLKKDELGDYVIPVVRQRPIFLLGAPGVGKTAIMEQIAGELQIALVSYSMTHHTRQSAIGLPFIKHQIFDGKEYDITEYTMSEIIATIYETMEESGIREGILFLDEINCVSETLSPSMLQFLQYKVFGRHRVPDGWVIVTAGNPPEYNKAVREFDVAVLDRMKILQVEPDYSIFKEYAIEKGLHPAIVNFLDMKREYFYRIENTVNGRSYVTARGWEDLSEILKLYEEEGLPADETLIGQYLTNETVVSEFGAYYELYNKYKRDYHVNEILGGMINETICKKAGEASFDERLSLLSMLLDQVLSDIKDNIRRLDAAANTAKILKGAEGKSGKDLLSYLEGTIEAGKKQLISLQRASAIGGDEILMRKRTGRLLEKIKSGALSGDSSYETVRSIFNAEVEGLKGAGEKCAKELHSLFDFAEKAFGSGDGNELLILVTELTVNPYSSRFIARFGSPDYEKHQKELMISERQINMQEEVRELLKEL
ncbi:MAG: AAA family ATPase [Lachnospiraceae bacterium]|nr:AAA family ATPase [Lachnospiraceae bacterium]